VAKALIERELVPVTALRDRHAGKLKMEIAQAHSSVHLQYLANNFLTR